VFKKISGTSQQIKRYKWLHVDISLRGLGSIPDSLFGFFYGRKGEEVAGGWRRLHNEELHNLYASPNVIRMMKSRRRDGGMQHAWGI
jgi:hypothetical protein